MANALFFVHALTSVHAGTGQGIDVIDLPIARERSTTLPFIPGSTLKGCLRDEARAVLPEAEQNAIFGPDRDHAHEHAGAVSVSDAQLVLFPVRSLAGTFVWATCPYILARFSRDASSCKVNSLPAHPNLNDGAALVASDAVLVPALQRKLVLEEYDLAAGQHKLAQDWAGWLGQRLFAGDEPFQRALADRFVILPDDVLFRLTRTATEIQAHIAINHDRGTVQDGALWYQESLPAETVLVGIARTTASRGPSKLGDADVAAKLFPASGRVQVGGKSGTGQGWVRVVKVGGGA